LQLPEKGKRNNRLQLTVKIINNCRDLRSFITGRCLMKSLPVKRRSLEISSVTTATALSSTSESADRAFLGTSGITVAHGYSTANPLEAQVKQAMIRSANETYVLADSSKFGHVYLESFASLSAISLTLTDSGMPGKFRDAFAERGIGFKCS
jgi:DeoR/GlpR family transcriptional regulator of sugar metabolism